MTLRRRLNSGSARGATPLGLLSSADANVAGEPMTKASEERPPPLLETHLGDGVYATFDGVRMSLRVTMGKRLVLHIKPTMFDSLQLFMNRCAIIRRIGEGNL